MVRSYFSALKNSFFLFLSQNKLLVSLFVFGTFFDAVATSYAVMKPDVVEINPISGGLIVPGDVLSTTLYVSLPSFVILGTFFLLWARADNKKFWRIAIEAGAVLQIAAGMNNTLIILGKYSPAALLAFSALFGSYVTRLVMNWLEYRERRNLLEKIPNPLDSEEKIIKKKIFRKNT